MPESVTPQSNTDRLRLTDAVTGVHIPLGDGVIGHIVRHRILKSQRPKSNFPVRAAGFTEFRRGAAAAFMLCAVFALALPWNVLAQHSLGTTIGDHWVLDATPWEDRNGGEVARSMSQLPAPVLIVYDHTQPNPPRTPGFVPVTTLEDIRTGLATILGDASISLTRAPGYVVAAETQEALDALAAITVSTSATIGLAATFKELSGALHADPGTTAAVQLLADFETMAGFRHTIWRIPHERCTALQFLESLLRSDSAISISVWVRGNGATLADSDSLDVRALVSSRGSDPNLLTPEGFDMMKARVALSEDELSMFLQDPWKFLYEGVSGEDTEVSDRFLYLAGQLSRKPIPFRSSSFESFGVKELTGLYLAYAEAAGYYSEERPLPFQQALHARLVTEAAELPAPLRARLAFELARASEFNLARTAILSLTEDATAREALDLHAQTDLGAALATIVYLRDDAPPEKGAATLAVTEALRAAEGTADRAAYWSIYAGALGGD